MRLLHCQQLRGRFGPRLLDACGAIWGASGFHLLAWVLIPNPINPKPHARFGVSGLCAPGTPQVPLNRALLKKGSWILHSGDLTYHRGGRGKVSDLQLRVARASRQDGAGQAEGGDDTSARLVRQCTSPEDFLKGFLQRSWDLASRI